MADEVFFSYRRRFWNLFLVALLIGLPNQTRVSSAGITIPIENETVDSRQDTNNTGNGSYTEDLPAWVTEDIQSNDGRTILVAQTEHPYSTPLEADEGIIGAVRKSIESRLANALAGHSLDELGFEDAVLKSSVIVPGTRIVRLHHERLEGDLAIRYGEEELTFYRGYAQVSFDDQFEEQVQQRVDRHRTKGRLRLAAFGAVGLLGLLTVLFAYLRVDHATRSFYSGRLQTIGVAVAVVLVLLIYFLASWFV